MARLNMEHGGYHNGTPVRLCGSFKYTAAGNLVDTIRDGHSFTIKSVTRISAGLYEITYDDGIIIPELPVTADAWVSGVAPTLVCTACVTTYTQSTKKFRIQVTKTGSTASGTYVQPAASDPDDQSRINFELVGSICSVGTDLA